MKPLRRGDTALLGTYDAFFTRARLTMLDVSAAILERATELRACYGFKVPDAIHLASAIETSADAFVTGDAALTKCPGLNVHLLSP